MSFADLNGRGDRLRKCEPSFVKGATRNHSGYSALEQSAQRDHIVDSRDPAGSNHRRLRGLRDRLVQLDIDTILGTIARYVSQYDGSYSGLLKAFQGISYDELTCLKPTFDGQTALTHIKRTKHASGMFPAGFRQHRRVEHRSRSDRDVVRARRQCLAYGIDGSQPSAYVQCAADRSADCPDRFQVARRAGDRTVEVHDVDYPRALVLEGAGGRRRVLAVNSRAVHLTAQQAHDLAVLQIDRRNNGELVEQARGYESVPLVESTPPPARGSRAVA